MKKNWEIKKLQNVCTVFEDGDWIESKDQSTNGIRLIQTGNIGNGFFKDRGEKARYISEDTFKKLKCTEIFERDCLISRLPDPVGRACIISNTNEKMITAVDCTIVRFQQKIILSEWFVFYSLSQEYQTQIKSEISGATRQRISRKNLGQINIPIPPLAEQQRIVAVLDKAFAAIATAKGYAERNLQNSKELFQSYLHNVFANKGEGWEEKKLGEVCESMQYGTSAKSNKTGKVAVLRMGNIQDGRFIWDNLVYTNDDDEIEKYRLKYNDVLFNRTNSAELVGKVAIYKGELPAIFAGYLIRINRKENLLDADFLNYYLNSEKIRQYGFSVMISSVNQANINATKLKEYPINLPSLKEQQAIVSKLDALSEQTKNLESIYRLKIADLEELKKSILQKAFNGEL